MIYKGNYRYDFADKIYDVVTDAFCEYYGKEYEYNVLSALDGVKLFLYNTREYVEKYYDYYITKFKSEIIKNFCKKLDITPTKVIEEVVWGKDNTLCTNNINYACIGEENPNENETFTDKLKEIICNCRENITNTFNLDSDSTTNYKQLLDLRQVFLESVKEIEKLHDCDVFRDIQKIEDNRKNGIKDLYTGSVANIYKISDKDKEILSSDNFESDKLYKLDCNHIFFNNDLEDFGYVRYFTKYSNEILKKGEFLDKILVKCNRLKYLDKAGFKLEKLNLENINSIEIKIRKCKRKAIPYDNEIDLYLIEKEYNTQKKKALNNEYVLDTNEKDKIKEWKKGNFIPENSADKLEELRKDLITKNLQENTKFTKHCFDSEFENFTIRRVKDNNLMRADSLVYINDDLASNPMSFLEVFIHELNHAISKYSPVTFTRKGVVMKGGSGLYSFKRNGMEIVDSSYMSNTNNVEEYVNQRQTLEIRDIVIRLIKERDMHVPFDKVVPTRETDYDVLYDYYGILLDDYYTKYKEELKKQNVEPGYNIYFKYDMAVNKLEKLINTPRDYLNRKFNKRKYYKNGCVDISKVTELNSIVDEFLEKVYPAIECSKLNSKDLFNLEKLKELPVDIRARLSKLINEKDNIMYEMEHDDRKKSEIQKSEM